ncbi:MAG: hypothetical protein JWM42_2175, partial [Burkholderia sp.]|nr:hypothetical protein [Burkholderia sp.]
KKAKNSLLTPGSDLNHAIEFGAWAIRPRIHPATDAHELPSAHETGECHPLRTCLNRFSGVEFVSLHGGRCLGAVAGRLMDAMRHLVRRRIPTTLSVKPRYSEQAMSYKKDR